jgi:hypothetical protein
MSPASANEPSDTEKTDANGSSYYREPYEALTGASLHVCPAWRRGRMITVEKLFPSNRTHSASSTHHDIRLLSPIPVRQDRIAMLR